MTRRLERVAGPVTATTGGVTLYTVPADTKVTLRELLAFNLHASSAGYFALLHRISGTDYEMWSPTTAIAAQHGERYVFNHVLYAGDVLKIMSYSSGVQFRTWLTAIVLDPAD